MAEESQAVHDAKNTLGFKVRKFYASYKLQMLVAEAMGTATLVFWGCMGCIDWWGLPGLAIQAALNFGLTVAFIMHMINHISFAVINPSITVVALGFGKLSLRMVAGYIVFEMSGAYIGYALLQALMPEKYVYPGFCVVKPHAEMNIFSFFIVEFLIVCALSFVCIGEWDSRNKNVQDSIPLKVGFAIAALCFAGSPVGISMNPAFAFGPALYNWDWEYHWIYWVAPFLGSTCTMTFYHYFFRRDEEVVPLVNRNEIKPDF